MNVDEVRLLALALAGATEEPHHGFPSFRVGKKIFATMPDTDHLNIMLEPESIQEAVAIDPAACEEQWWGKKLTALRVSIPLISEDVLAGLLEEAWQRRKR